MTTYSKYSYTPSASFARGIDALPTIQQAVSTAFSGVAWNGKVPAICAIELQSTSPFAVQLNAETILTAAKIGDTYNTQHMGTIDRVLFSSSVALSSIWCAWTIE